MHITREQFEQIGAVARKARQLLQELGNGMPVTIAINRVALGTVEIAEQLEAWQQEAQQPRHPHAGKTLQEIKALPELSRHVYTAIEVAYYDFIRYLERKQPHAYSFYPSEFVKIARGFLEDEATYQHYPHGSWRWQWLHNFAVACDLAYRAGYESAEQALTARLDTVRSTDPSDYPDEMRDEDMAAAWAAYGPTGDQYPMVLAGRKAWFEQGFCEGWDESDVLDMAAEAEAEEAKE